MPDLEPTPSTDEPINPALLALLCCPVCAERPPLRLADNGLHCDQCGRIFPIHDGLPDLRPESGILPTDASPASADAS